MSNIPPEPPDPPQTAINAVGDPNSQPRGNQSNRGRRGNRGHIQRNSGRVRDESGLNKSSVELASHERGNHLRHRGKGRVRGQRNISLNGGHGAFQESVSTSQRAHSPHESAPIHGNNDITSSYHGKSDQHTSRVALSGKSSRRGKINSKLSTRKDPSRYVPGRANTPPAEGDLTTRLTHSLRTPPYPDCPICFNPLHPAQPTWACSVNSEVTTCCWAIFHLKCVREWARKSTKEVKNAFMARGEINEEGYWRCPGCQTKRTIVPRSYQCFCGNVTDPKPGVATPHSCGMSCSRKRQSCEHVCPLNCHPGPCPPCVLTVNPSCYCGKTIMTMRCATAHATPSPLLSCGQPCNRPLACGNHFCLDNCHLGDCKPCEETELITCFCGKQTKTVACGEGIQNSLDTLDNEGGKRWTGRYICEQKCMRFFVCGIHTCSKGCHTPSPLPDQCPFDPKLITHCPCGKHPLEEISDTARTKCVDDVPTCDSTCGKALEGCSHYCSVKCHQGPCPPCSIPITVTCRCGSTTKFISCRDRQLNVSSGEEVLLCDRICGGWRLCGRHQCTRICCPLASLSKGKGKGKKKLAPRDLEFEEQELLWHECNLICDKLLSCGNHRCSEPDHKGACPPCLQSSFEELVCDCTRTVLLPPVRCGTKINCSYPCARPPPPCGHGRAVHTCHEDDVPCPPCPFLTTKRCACGKTNVNNVRCSQEKVACGQPCGKLLDCGFHKCQRLCHGDGCDNCLSVCGKPRKLCLPAHHPCTLSCHAPSACSEDEPCMATVTVSCPCGRYQQPVKCGRSTANPSKSPAQLLCRDECGIAKRNARLADALGITTTKTLECTYSEELVVFGRANGKFMSLVEKTLNDFVMSDKKTQVLPYMPESRRNFVRELCQVYRIDTQLVDQEPRRSVQVHRRIDTRVPNPLLSAFIVSQSAASSLGRLTDLRTMPSRPAVPPTSVTRPSMASASTRGWTSVVTNTPQTSVARMAPAPSLPKVKPNEVVRDNWESD